jgi:type IV secretory pathway TraG/TraD family ATPase VirD4
MFLGRLSHSPLFAGGQKHIHTARFARAYELRPLIGADPTDRGASLLLGIGPYGRLLRVRSSPTRRELGNLLVDAPTRAGKGLLAVSQLLTWPHSVIVNDIKGDLFEQTAGDRVKRGPVVVIDPRGFGHRFDPLQRCRTEEDLRAMAVHLLFKSHEREPDPFTKRAVKMLTAIFSAGKLEGHPLLPYAAHMLHIGPERAAQRLETLSRYLSLPENQNLATRLLDRKFEDADFSDRYLQSSWSCLTGDMDPIITETVLASLAGSDFSPEDILRGRPVTVYLRFPESRLLSLSPLVRLIWSSLLDELIALYDQRRGAGSLQINCKGLTTGLQLAKN